MEGVGHLAHVLIERRMARSSRDGRGSPEAMRSAVVSANGIYCPAPFAPVVRPDAGSQHPTGVRGERHGHVSQAYADDGLALLELWLRRSVGALALADRLT